MSFPARNIGINPFSFPLSPLISTGQISVINCREQGPLHFSSSPSSLFLLRWIVSLIKPAGFSCFSDKPNYHHSIYYLMSYVCVWSQRSMKGKTPSSLAIRRMYTWGWKCCCGRSAASAVTCSFLCVCDVFIDHLLGVFPLSDLSDVTHADTLTSSTEWSFPSSLLLSLCYIRFFTTILHMWVKTRYDQTGLEDIYLLWKSGLPQF